MKLSLAASLLLSSSLSLSADAADKLPITLTISGPQTAIVGDPIIIRPILMNVSDRKFSSLVIGAGYIIRIHSDNGMEVPPNGEPGPVSLIWDDLSSGEPRSDFPVNLIPAYTLPVGKYVVQFERHLDPRDYKSPILRSNEITITVVPPLALTISGPETVTAGDRIIVQPVLKNVSDRTLSGFRSRADYAVTIFDEDGLELIPGPRDWGGSISFMPISPHEVSPGSTITDLPVRLDLMYSLVPGKYSVQFASHVDPNDSKSPMIKSNWIAINVLPAAEKHGLR